ncbi:hypothetical protein HHK36_018630 [Tetracentron sinense]|uniref:AAA+ ATPase domain-containing protein n=1 Tax=Tetracentron sinense TaxID=13715 RepID=A0A835DDQ5_TETSI|nr:hypothetical protein HHK36_018630 [Tetracentron sinense]
MAVVGILGVVITPLVEITKCLTIPLKREIGYLVHYKRNVENLKIKVTELGRKRNDVQGSVDVASRKGDVIKEEVLHWVRRVGEIEADMTRLDDELNQNRRYFVGWCPNCRWHYGLGKEAMNKIEEAKELLGEGNFSVVSLPAPPPSIESQPTGDFEVFDSTGTDMNLVVNALKDENVNIVGVYGMGGVGKTTLVTEVAKQVNREKLFNEIVMVTVSRNHIKTIQRDLGEKLGMKLEEENEDVRAGRLRERLQQKKPVLVILDDLWDELQLAKVGVPYGDDPNKDYKIVITSRSKYVCSLMGCKPLIEVQVLTFDNSWSLFRKKMGSVFDVTTLQDVAKDIVKECGGLPLAIITIAGALRNKERLVWEDALEQLKNSSPTEIPGMDRKVYSPLMLSYNYIEREKCKLLFLFCCLFEEDENIHMRDLLIYGIGEDLFPDVNTLTKAKKRLYTMVNNLIDSSLLLYGDKDGPYVRMHDLVRDVAIYIASEIDHGFLVKPRANLNEWPQMRNPNQYKRISLMRNEIVELSGTPMCPQMQTLLLQYNKKLPRTGYGIEYLGRIEDSFFQGMESLVVLDLSGASIPSLPTSISLLKNLRTLNLSSCWHLKDFSPQGQEKLEVLILRDSGIHELPKEIGRQSNLKLLDLSNTKNLNTIPRNTISQLGHLEELLMDNSFKNWEVEQTGGEWRAEVASFAELASLPALRILKIHVKNVECVYQEISYQWKNLEDFVINVGNHGDLTVDELHYFCRILMLNGILRPISDWVKKLLERTEFLEIMYCSKSSGLFQSDLLLLQRLHRLTELRVKYCEEFDEIFCYEGTIEGHPLLSRLRVLRLSDLDRLTSIWNGIVPSGTLPNLETVDVFSCERLCSLFSFALAQSIQQLQFLRIWRCPNMENLIWMEDIELTQLQSATIFQNLREVEIIACDSMKSVFSLSLGRGLQNLEKLVIDHCDGIEEIIIADDKGMGVVTEKVELPQLQVIELVDLPKLKCFFYQATVLELPLLDRVKVLNCPNLKRFPLEPQSIPNLKKIGTDSEWFEGLEWEDQSFKSRLQALSTDPRV